MKLKKIKNSKDDIYVILINKTKTILEKNAGIVLIT